jgi:hypothetical protein
MAAGLDDNAKSFRRFPREEVIARLKGDSDKMMEIFDSLTPDDWNTFIVTHPYMGGLPTLFYPAFHVMDYGVHTWDIEWGLGKKDEPMDERAAAVLVPYMIGALLPSTVDAGSVAGADFEVGLEVDGEWGGTWIASAKDGKFGIAPAENLDNVPAKIRFASASDFVLTCFQRFPGGEESGDPKMIAQYRKLFFKI